MPPIPKDPDSIESECYNPHRDARRKKNGVDNPAFGWGRKLRIIERLKFDTGWSIWSRNTVF